MSDENVDEQAEQPSDPAAEPPEADAAPADAAPADAAPSEAAPSAPDNQNEDDDAARFFIVGVGASAGGLDALNALLRRLSLEGMALVIVQHLAPMHESLLPTLLMRSSNLDAVTAEDGMKVAPGHIYVIPPNADLAILNGVLHLMPLGSHSHGARLPIDYFLRSLAEDQGSRAIGVVLSGTGTDGTFGLKAVKEAGGITFAQEPTSARYDGMPRHAIESGFADFSLTPELIAEELMSISKHPYLARVRTPAPQTQENIGKLLVLMRTAFGHDLTYYKTSTIDRRIERRMALHKIARLPEYIRFVQSNAEELRLLYKDMLIGVTAFFRDHEAFDAIKTKLLPRLLEHKQIGSTIRVWVPACSTGEEAYSFAMAVLEYLDDRAQDFRIQIFGTDIDEVAIQHARRGVFPHNIALDVSPERLHRFFSKRENDYQIARRIRDMVVFSVQNVAKDAPFSRLDLVSCRNLLIYLQPPMQRKVLRILHYALNPGGFLMLGTSETVGDASELFSLIDRKNKLYLRKNVAAATSIDIGFGVQAHESVQTAAPRLSQRPVTNLSALADRKILELYGPAGVVINDDLEVVHLRGRTGAYLEPTPGTPSFHLLRLARPELHVDLRRVIHEAKTTNQRVTIESKLTDDGQVRAFKLEAVPIVDPDSKSRSLLVLFHEPAAPRDLAAADDTRTATDAERQRTQELEHELLVTKEYLQSTIEELESANEELKSSNEELQSSNEELQSTNEELETSKEELQSANEELTTVNDELQSRMSELQQSNDDLYNVLTSVGSAVVIVGMDLRIRRFTHVAERLLNLVEGDVGRSVGQLNAFVIGRRLEDLAAQVIQTLAPVAETVLCADHRWYALHVTPYKTLDHSIKGAVIVLIDDDARKRAVDVDRTVTDYAANVLAVISHPLMIINRKRRVLWVNPVFLRTFKVVAEATIGNVLPQVTAIDGADEKLSDAIDATLATGDPFRDHVVQAKIPGAGERAIRVSGSRIPPLGGETMLVLLAFEEGERPTA